MKGTCIPFHHSQRTAIFAFFALCFTSLPLWATDIQGIVLRKDNAAPISGVTIRLEGHDIGTISRRDGRFTLALPPGEQKLKATAIGFSPVTIIIKEDREDLLIELEERTVFLGEDVAVVGNRTSTARSNVETPVPVDVISGEQLRQTGQFEVGQALNFIAPSFRSGRQTFADGTDHSDPAMLRGLGPDQALVLINGKRRHTSSLVNVTPIVGRGSVGTDLNAIPVAAVERIEILRDGAAALYGSDAIAGVINIVLKSDSALSVEGYGGATTAGDGQVAQASFHGGWNIGEGGYITLTGEARRREATNRTGTFQGLIYRGADQDGLSVEENRRLDDSIMQARGRQRSDFDLIIGNSAQTQGSLFLNAALPLNERSEAYLFAGVSRRESRAPGFYRFPIEARNNPDIYPDGFMPFLAPTIQDQSLSAGVRGATLEGWRYDFSNTYGQNTFDFAVENSLNRALGNNSPTNFYAGGLAFRQNTSNLDFSKNFMSDIGGSPLLFGLAFGGEVRLEEFRQTEGEEASWAAEEEGFVPGSQGFPGFRPDYAQTGSRSAAAAYIEGTLDWDNRAMLTLASRYENFSDFGQTLIWRAGARVNIVDEVAVRGAIGTGFRAPSLHQRFFSSASTIFIPVDAAGTLAPFDVVTPTNNSRLAQAFGIESLTQERSLNISAGITAKPIDNLFMTLDAYSIEVKDRIVLTGFLSRMVPAANAILNDFPDIVAAQFFTNAVDTRSEGIDVVVAYSLPLGGGTLDLSAAGTFARTSVEAIRIPEQLAEAEEAFFGREEIARLEIGQPQTMLTFSAGYRIAGFGITARTTQFGEVGSRWAPGTLTDQDYSAKWLTDVYLSYSWQRLTFFAGVQNLFDVYPDENLPQNQSFGRFRFNTAVTQFGFNGASFYGGLRWNL